MKKYIIAFSALLAYLVSGCKKDKDMVSHVANVSYPTITVNGLSVTGVSLEDYYLESIGMDQTGFLSIQPGQSLNISGYDSSTNQTVNVSLHNTPDPNLSVPGMYILDYAAHNQEGYYTLGRFYTAVTDVSPSIDLSGNYYGIMDGDTLTDEAEIVREANGLYMNTDVTADGSGIAAVFVHLSDNTIVFAPQPDLSGQIGGNISSTAGTVDTTGGQTVITYQLVNKTINDAYGATTVFKLVKVD